MKQIRQMQFGLVIEVCAVVTVLLTPHGSPYSIGGMLFSFLGLFIVVTAKNPVSSKGVSAEGESQKDKSLPSSINTDGSPDDEAAE